MITDALNNVFGSVVILDGCQILKLPVLKNLHPLIENKKYIASLFFMNHNSIEHGCLYSSKQPCPYKGAVKCPTCKETLLSRKDMKLLKSIARLGGPMSIQTFLLEKNFKLYFPETI